MNIDTEVNKVSANSVPAAAVKRGIQALSGITGRKAYVGGFNIFLYKENYIFVFY